MYVSICSKLRKLLKYFPIRRSDYRQCRHILRVRMSDYEKFDTDNADQIAKRSKCKCFALLMIVIVSLNGILCCWGWYRYVDRQESFQMFDEYIVKHGKQYRKGSGEYTVRFDYFKESLKEIDRLNRESQGPEQLRARYKHNKFSDLSKEEFTKAYLSGLMPVDSCNNYREGATPGTDPDRQPKNEELMVGWTGNTTDLPKAVDWREKDAVGPIEDQLQCGACWAFSTIGVIESFVAIHLKHPRPKLSVQQLLDCVGGCNSRCNGGDPVYTMRRMFSFGTVVVPQTEYPLTLVNQTCVNVAGEGYMLTSFPNDCNCIGREDEIKRILAKHGPVAVNVDAMAWQNYNGGIIQNNCSPDRLNHAVQIVGYNEEGEIPYYIVKNSWGTEWNDLGGYVYIAMYRNECGVATSVVTPVDVCRARIDPGSYKGKCV